MSYLAGFSDYNFFIAGNIKNCIFAFCDFYFEDINGN